MDNLSNHGRFKPQPQPSSEMSISSADRSSAQQSIFPGNYLGLQNDSLKKPFYPVAKKDPLEIPYHQKVAFAMTVLSLASTCLGGKNASWIGNVSLACHVGLSLINFAQNPSISAGMPLGMMGLQSALAFTPFRPVLPYWNLLLQGRSTYTMGKDVWNQVGISLQHVTKDNYLTVGRNLFVYGVNALSSGYNLYRGYQNTNVQKDPTSAPSPEDIENAKKVLCQGQKECPADWNPKEVKKLFRKQSLSAHPDKTGTNEAFDSLTRARDLLLSIFKTSPQKPNTSSTAPVAEPSGQEASSFGLQQVQEKISSWGDSIWGFLTAFDKYFSLPVAGAAQVEREISVGPVLTNKELAHVLGDPYIQGTSLEGLNFESSTRMLVDLSADASAALRQDIESLAKKIRYVSESNAGFSRLYGRDIASKVKNLQEGEEFWLEGGWAVKGGTGHAMLYQWVKRVDGNYDIYIYNTGDGLEYHYQETKTEGSFSKKVVSPFVKFKGVPGKAMGLEEGYSSGELFDSLISVKNGADEKDPAKQIYLEIFGAFNEYRVTEPEEGDLLIAPQTSGTCSWYVLIFAALRKRLQSVSLSDKTDFEREEKAFQSSCGPDQASIVNPERNEICISGAHKLLLDLAGLHDNGIRHEDVENYREKIQESLDAFTETQGSIPSLEGLNAVSYVGTGKAFPSETWSLWSPNKPSKETDLQTIPFSSRFLDGKKIGDLIQETQKILQFSEDVPHDVVMRIESLVQMLPKPSELKAAWNGASLEQIQQTVELLSSVLTKYATKTLSHDGRLLTEQNTAWALVATIHQLSTRLNPDLGAYGIFHQSFTDLIKNPLFTNFRREDLERYQELSSYFTSLPQSAILFDPNQAVRGFQEGDIQKKTVDDEFLEKVSSKHRNIVEKLQSRAESEKISDNSIPEWMIKRKILRTDNQILGAFPETAYLSSLRMATYSAHAFTRPLSKSSTFSSYPMQGFIDVKKKTAYFSDAWEIEESRKGEVISIVPDSNSFSRLSSSGQCLFSAESHEKENSAVLQASSWRPEIDPILDSTGCQKTLQSQLIVNHFKDNIDTLTAVKNQNILLLQLFKSHPSSTPIHEDMQNPHFISSVSELIEKGVGRFCYNRKRPDIKMTLFFLQIARRVRELDPQVNLRDFAADINQLLARQDLTDEEKRLLHMHRILQYTTQKNTLLMLQKSSITNNAPLKEILISWMHVSAHKFSAWHDFHSQSEMVHFIHDLAPVFEKLPDDFLHAVISDLIPTHRKPFTRVLQAGNSLGFYTAVDPETEIWSIIPLHGKILKNGQQTQFGVQKDFTQLQEYKRLFGDQKFSFTKDGNSYLFQDSHQNTFRIFESGRELKDPEAARWEKGRKEGIVQMQFEGQWYQYVTKDNGLTTHQLAELLKKVPKSLLADHFVFRSEHKTLFVRKDNFAIDFVDFQAIAEEGKSTLQENPTLDPSIENFEGKSWVLERGYDDGSFKLEMPRFVSLTAMPLEFKRASGKLAWSENPRFVLKKAPEGLLGLCKNYLLLQDEEKSKLLVPLKPVEPSEEFAPHCTLDIQDETRKEEYLKAENSGPFTGELNSPQEKKYRFIDYDLENGKPKPLNIEGALFLSYLSLAQKDYTTAIKILQEDLNLKAHFTHTDLTKQILFWIINHPVSSYDRSASAAAFALKALLLLPEKQEDWDIEYKMINVAKQLRSTYQNGLDRVQADLRLSTEEWEEISKRFSEYDQEKTNQDDVWNWKKENTRSSGWSTQESSYSRMIRYLEDGGPFREFGQVYEAFRQAKTKEEKAFLKLRYREFFKKGDIIYPAILQAVVSERIEEGKESKYPPLPKAKMDYNAAREWLRKFNTESDLILVSPRKVPAKSSKRSSPSARSLTQSLKKIESVTPQAPFPLSPMTFSREPFLRNLIQKSFLQENAPIRKSFLDEDRLLNQPITELYEAAVTEERSAFIQEYQKGLEKNQAEPQFTLKSGVTTEQVHAELEARLTSLNLQEKKQEILDLVNRLPDDERQKTLTLLLEGSQAKAKIRMHEVINSFLKGKSEGYLALNSHLTKEEIQKLDKLAKEFLVAAIEAAQLEKALKTQDPQELGLLLSAEMAYTSSEYDMLQRQFLVYEYRAGLRMRKEQVALILQMAQKKSCVTQLMMGGGKTSVLASNLLYFAAKPGRIPFFIPPASQFSTLKENLGNMQKKHFHQEVIPIQMKRSELTEKNLIWIKQQFAAAKTGKVILTTRETIESIVLEYLDLLGKVSEELKSGNRKIEDMDFSHIDENEPLVLLSFLVKEMKNSGDVLVDEVDLILNPMQETNFPFGQKTSIEPALIDMTRQMFTLLSSPKFDEKIRMRSNQQAVLSEKEHREILLDVMKDFFDQRQDLSLTASEKEAFLDFISGRETGRAFRQHLEFMSQKETLKSSAAQISLLKHLSSDILPLTLSKSTGENYGRVLEEVTVGPYHGVNSPSFTEFGSQWEAMIYHFQTALARGVTSKQVQDVYDVFFQAAGMSADLQGIAFEETDEAKAFKELTGCTFAEYPAHAQQVLEHINKNPHLQLQIEANSIAKLVGYYSKYFRSTSQNFAASFSGFDSFSGTPWNPESFPKDLETNFHPDAGTEGKILDVFLERAAKKSLKIHTTTSIKPKETLSQVLGAMTLDRRNRVSGFIDSGGLFKESSGLSVAQDVLNYYKDDPRIQSVLFFDRPQPSSPMVLMALKKGSKKPVIVGGTQPGAIAKHGLQLKSTFVYYDQTHCEATDILQKADAINLISVNHRTIKRTLTQGILRLRNYFKGQDVEVVIPQSEVTHFSVENSRPSHQDVLLKSIDNQAMRKADQTFRSYRQKADHALREIVMEMLRKAKNLGGEIQIFRKYEEVLITSKDHDLYSQFGSPEVVVDSLQSLVEYCNQKKALFERLSGADKETYKKADRLLSEIIQSASNSPYRPSMVKQSVKDDAGTELEIAQEVEVENETDHSISRELQRELESYQTSKDAKQVAESSWTVGRINQGLKKGKYADFLQDGNAMYSLKDVLSYKGDRNSQIPSYLRDYSSLFGDNFLVSRNFLRNHDKANYIFDKASKAGRQILIVQEKGELKSILLSTAEANFFKGYIKNNKPQNMWLVLPTGRPYIGNAPEMSPALKDLLWQVNLFNGNVEALIKHDLTPLKRKKLNAKLLHDFLFFKIRNPGQSSLLQAHFAEDGQEKEKDSLSVFRSMSGLTTEKEHLDDYEPLVELGITQVELEEKTRAVRQILLHHIEAVRKLRTHKINIPSIMKLPAGDLIKVLENVDSLIITLQKGVTLPTVLKIITGSKKAKAAAA